MKLRLILVALLVAGPAWAEEVWVLETGPEATEGIPLDPVQPVPAWRGRYGDGLEQIWVYVTQSPHFFAPSRPEVRAIQGTRWTVVGFFPAPWTPSSRTAWLSRWVAGFQNLATLPDPGWPVVYPAILRKD